MKARPKTLPDSPRGGAWPSSVRTVRRSVKSDNERDPRLQSRFRERSREHTEGIAAAKAEEGEVYGRSVCPESPGQHARYKGWDNGIRPRKGKAILKPSRSLDRGL
jgi:hypothetical protein